MKNKIKPQARNTDGFEKSEIAKMYDKPQAAKPSPLPWRIVAVKDYILVKAPEGCRIAELKIPRGGLNNANARLIVKAVNAHAGLVEALREMLTVEADTDSTVRERARAALRAAGEAV